MISRDDPEGVSYQAWISYITYGSVVVIIGQEIHRTIEEK
jgi:hypothetical protein